MITDISTRLRLKGNPFYIPVLNKHGWQTFFLHIGCSTPSADPESVPWLPTLAARVGEAEGDHHTVHHTVPELFTGADQEESEDICG